MTTIKLETKQSTMQTEAYWENLVKRSLCRFLLLAQLAKGPVHGYGINQAIKEACQGFCEPTEAMVYSTMKELQDGGYVDCRMEVHQGRQRRVCWLDHLWRRGVQGRRPCLAADGPDRRRLHRTSTAPGQIDTRRQI